MLNDYTNKNVRILVASGSGSGAISAGERYSNGVMTSVMNVYGNIERVDDKFIEVKNARYTLYNLDTEKPIALNHPISIDTPIFESDSILVSVNSVIIIALI